MTSISSPTLLATFSNNHASSSKLPHVVLSPVIGASESLAVAAVQGDGIWTYDVSSQSRATLSLLTTSQLNTLRPTTSFTVSPSTTFASPALSFIPTPLSEKAKSKQKANGGTGVVAMDVDGAVGEDAQDPMARVTMVVVMSGDQIRQDQQGKIIWVWKGEEGGEKQEVSVR
jgi:hypothetical protein